MSASTYCGHCQLPFGQCQHGLERRVRQAGAIACSGGRPLTHGDVEVVEAFTSELRARAAKPHLMTGPADWERLDAMVEERQGEAGPLFCSQYAGRCPGCGGRYLDGDFIAWSPGEGRYVCADCARGY